MMSGKLQLALTKKKIYGREEKEDVLFIMDNTQHNFIAPWGI